MAKFYCVDQIHGLPGEEENLLKAFEVIAAEIRKCKGCEAYEVYKNGIHADHFILYERWTTREDFDNHTTMESLGALARERNKYLAQPIDFDIFFERVV